MQIRCPACGATAQLPSSKEGAKVRCGSCSRVYVARDPRQRGSSKNYNGIIAAVCVAAVAGMAMVFLGGSGSDEPEVTLAKEAQAPVQAVEAEEEPPPEVKGWAAPSVQAAAAVHEAAQSGEVDRLIALLDASRLPGDGDPAELARTAADSLVNDEANLFVKDWRPYDGEILTTAEDHVVVHLSVQPYDDELGPSRRTVAWSLSGSGANWKAFAWEPVLSAAERRKLAAEEKRASVGYEVVRYEDGSVVAEREPEPLGHLDDTPPELRSRIDELFATMVNLDLTREASDARRELIEIGRPVIPILLTDLFTAEIVTMDDSVRANIVVEALREITGRNHGFQPLVGSGAMATTQEKRDSAIKQWFAWWYRHEDDFVEKEEGEDLLNQLLPPQSDDE